MAYMHKAFQLSFTVFSFYVSIQTILFLLTLSLSQSDWHFFYIEILLTPSNMLCSLAKELKNWITHDPNQHYCCVLLEVVSLFTTGSAKLWSQQHNTSLATSHVSITTRCNEAIGVYFVTRRSMTCVVNYIS